MYFLELQQYPDFLNPRFFKANCVKVGRGSYPVKTLLRYVDMKLTPCLLICVTLAQASLRTSKCILVILVNFVSVWV